MLHYQPTPVVNKLKIIFGRQYNEFVKHLIDNHALISGSFVLRSLIKGHWVCGDIDIYVDQLDTSLHKFLKEHSATTISNRYYSKPVVCSTTYNYNNINIQINTINPEYGCRKFILDFYDLGILKNYIEFEQNAVVLYVHHPEMVGTKTSNVIVRKGPDGKSTMDRMVKYSERGISFTKLVVE